jgi:hypothetical protein
MLEYERHLPRTPPPPEPPAHFPHLDRTWTIGTMIAAVGSLMTVIVVIIGGFWNYAGLSYMTSNVPAIKRTQEDLQNRVTVLEVQQRNNDSTYTEILRQLNAMGDKLDKLRDSKADKQTREYPP